MVNARAIKDIIYRGLSFESIDEFACVNSSTDLVSNQFNACYNELNQYFTSGINEAEPEVKKESVQELVKQIYAQQHPKKQLVILRLIVKLVSNRVLDVREVVEHMLANLVYADSKLHNGNLLYANNQNNLFNSNVTQTNLQRAIGDASHQATSSYLWHKVFECIYKCVPLHDYKTCRDIFKTLLELIKRLPHSNTSYPPVLRTELSVSKSKPSLADIYGRKKDAKQRSGDQSDQDVKLESLYEIISLLLDKEKYLMPRYLALNEIKTVLSFGKEHYHERFHDLIANFIESFIPVAHLISFSGRDKLMPVFGIANLYSVISCWRFNPNSCRINHAAPLPYYKHASKLDHEVLFYMMRQNTSQYMLLNLMQVVRNARTRYPAYEEEFIQVIIDTMRFTDENESAPSECLRIWGNLVNHLINSLQLLNVPAMIHQLGVCLKKQPHLYPASRDWLMWFFLFSGLARTCPNQLIDLFEILYKDEEPLPVPDMTKFVSVIRLAPLSVWYQLNYKGSSQQQQQNQDSALSSSNSSVANASSNTMTGISSALQTAFAKSTSATSKIQIIPDILKNQYAFFQECTSNQNYQDFRLSVCFNTYCGGDQNSLQAVFQVILEQIGKSFLQKQQLSQNQMSIPPGGSPNAITSSLYTNHQPLSIEFISSLTRISRSQLVNYLLTVIIQRVPSSRSESKVLSFNIPSSIVETFARLVIVDSENFMKHLTQNWWNIIANSTPANLPLPIAALQQHMQLQQQQMQIPPNLGLNQQIAFLNQQLNALIELVAYRIKHLSFSHRTSLFGLLNGLFNFQSKSQQQQQAQSQGQPGQPAQPQQQSQRTDTVNFIKHPIIYMNVHCAMLKIFNSFYGTDFYELISSLNSKAMGFINTESEELNKAFVILVARAFQFTSSDTYPLDNKDREEPVRVVLREVSKATPIHFHDHVLQYFPKFMQDFLQKEQQQHMIGDSSNKQYKAALSRKVEEDYKKFLDCRHESQVPNIFQNSPIQAHTILCILFLLMQDESVQQNFGTYLSFIASYLNSIDNKKLTQSLRTLCDYLISESNNKPIEAIKNYAFNVIKMIKTYNIFTYDRFLLIMTFRSLDASDLQLALVILNQIFAQNIDFQAKLTDFLQICETMSTDEWKSVEFYQFVSTHPDRMFHEGLKEQLGHTGPYVSESQLINTYYTHTIVRCIPVLDFLNSRYLELGQIVPDADSLLNFMNQLFKFHPNPIAFAYQTLMYYNKRENQSALGGANLNQSLHHNQTELIYKAKKKRIFSIIAANQSDPNLHFTPQFQQFLKSMDPNMDISSDQDISYILDLNYFYTLMDRLINRMSDRGLTASTEFRVFKSEFQNPSCHLLYVTLCELMCLDLFAIDPLAVNKSICTRLIEVLSVSRLGGESSLLTIVEKQEFVYWTNAAGLIIGNLPEAYWQPIYEILIDVTKPSQLFRQFGDETDKLGDEGKDDKEFYELDLYLADEHDCFTQLTLVITLFHAIWCHANANHIHYFAKFLKERREELIKSESHFLFICKLIGPALSKIHYEHSSLLIEISHEFYDMLYLVDQITPTYRYSDTICNFFYHLKYRHIGEHSSIKEKIHSLMPKFSPEIRKKLKFITSEASQILQKQEVSQQN